MTISLTQHYNLLESNFEKFNDEGKILLSVKWALASQKLEKFSSIRKEELHCVGYRE